MDEEEELCLEDDGAEVVTAEEDESHGLCIEQYEDGEDDELQLEGNDDDDELQLEGNDQCDELQLEGNDDASDNLELEGNENADPEPLLELDTADFIGANGSSTGGGRVHDFYAAPTPPDVAAQLASLDQFDWSKQAGRMQAELPEWVEGMLPKENWEWLTEQDKKLLAYKLQEVPESVHGNSHRLQIALRNITANATAEHMRDAARMNHGNLGSARTLRVMREQGDELFACGSFSAARHAYTAGLEIADEPDAESELMSNPLFAPERDKMCDEKALALTNRAAAAMKQLDYNAAIEDASAALCYDTIKTGTRRKALTRRAQSYEKVGEPVKAQADYDLANRLALLG
eukprot:CAMPEP_0119305136 /NCGR_PEP_ID=MMETSP1333-20130426/6206_1 /TAXON_ID=418940 /ORGANISM="Scyphosphaera apsteinii, Strain RCC1455" /LENGTH=346 /DNA_ID=CAMNT_0007308157 /DNA_START=153 /DNA_END=1193 /DNA_ORIENTATION=+